MQTEENKSPPNPADGLPYTEASRSFWPAFWYLLSAALSFWAAINAFNHDGKEAITNGGLALVAALIGLLHVSHQKVQMSKPSHGFGRLQSYNIALIGFALFNVSSALVMHWSLKSWRGLDLWGDLYLWKEGVISMALLFALLFTTLALLYPFLRNRRHWTDQKFTWVALISSIILFFCGPEITVENNTGNPDLHHALYIKRSLPQVLKAATVEEDFLEASTNNWVPVICVAEKQSSAVFFSWKKPNPIDYANCAAEVKAALSSGRAIESDLYKNQIEYFFARLNSNPEGYRDRKLAADVSQLPEPLRSQLTALLPVKYLTSFTAFDVALATRNADAAAMTMPRLDYILPHQRQGLFNLGLFGTLENTAGETLETLAQKRHEQFQTSLNVGIMLGSKELLKSAVNNLIVGGLAGDAYSDFRGGFTDYDYYMANRHCDIGYAKFLHSEEIPPNAQHIIHLLSIIGRAQYPNLTNLQWAFTSADDSLGLPDEKQLNACVDLAELYATTVQDFNIPTAYQINNNYDIVYGIANDGVFEWWSRDNEKIYHHGNVRDTSTRGDPAVLTNAAAAILKKQPASYEQFCAWANTSHTWQALVTKQQPKMVEPLLALAGQWKNAKTVYKTDTATCNLKILQGITNEYEKPQDALAFMNAGLKKMGIPCMGEYSQKDGSSQLTCNIKTQPWPEPSNEK